jgi:Ca-activated chloride channel family protein
MGRHSHRSRRRFDRLGREPAALAAVLVAALAGSVVAVRLVSSTPAHPEAACPGPSTTLSVGVDTSALPWMTSLARSYNDAHHLLDGACIRVAVRELTAAQALQALQPVPFPGGGPPTDVWIPESTTTLQLVRARAENQRVLPAAATSVASSPIVVAAPTDAVRAIAAKLPAGQAPNLGDFMLLARDPAGWGQQKIGHGEWGRVLFSTADPTKTTLGASMLVAAAGAVTGTPPQNVTAKTFTDPAAKAGLLQFVRSLGKIAPSTAGVLAGADLSPDTQDLLTSYGLVGTYEQDVWRYNSAHPAVLLTPTYPLGGQLAADYPYVVPNASWVSGLDRRAATDLRNWLASADVQGRLAGYGLRRANGTADAALTGGGAGLAAGPLPPEPIRSPDGPAAAQAVWRLLTQRVSVLALVDVSGSMADPVPGTGKSKLQIAVAAAGAGLQLFDDADHIGLWEFSSQIDGQRDYRELVPVGRADGKVGKLTRRQASVLAQRGLKPLTGTGLYDSVLAAYQSAVAHFQRGYVNTVVLITDGKNDDRATIGLDGLLSQLKKAYDLARPVHIVAIAYGKDADAAVLGRIAKATDGLAFDSPDPRSIGQVFLTAIGALTS